ALIPPGALSAKDAKGQPAEYDCVHLVFAADHSLAERRIVRMPKREVRYRETYGRDGTIRLLGADDKELAVRKGTLSPAKAPVLNPDLSKYVVLALPFRTAAHVRQTLKIENKAPNLLRFDEGRPLLAAEFAANNAGQAQAIFQQCFHAREQREPGARGLHALWAAGRPHPAGQNPASGAGRPAEPLAQYLALHSSPVLRTHASQWAVLSRQWADGPLQHLSITHALYQGWRSGK